MVLIRRLNGAIDSLSVLSLASLWHFQQLIRTKFEVVPIPMRRLRVPFELVAGSMHLKAGSIDAASDCGSNSQSKSQLVFTVRSESTCSVRVFWGVTVKALDEDLASTPSSASSSSSPFDWSNSRRRKRSTSLLRKLSSATSFPGSGVLPNLLTSHHQRRHRLHNDEADGEDDQEADADGGTSDARGFHHSRLFSKQDYTSKTDEKRSDPWLWEDALIHY